VCAWYKGIEIPDNDAERVAAVHSYDILDSDPETEYDDIAELAATIVGCRVSYIGFFDDERLWLKAKYGLPPTLTERPRELTLCSPTICQNDLVVVRDMSQDPHYAELPTVKNPPNAKFYCAMPLINPEGYALGTLCVWDPEPKDIDAESQQCMRRLGRLLLARLESRRRIIELDQAQSELQAAVQSAARAREDRDALLRSVFPSDIAEKLLAGEKVLPRFFGSVSVLFIDFESFTGIAESMEPRTLIEQLDEYFSLFDRIVRDHGLEKIKTVGDAYMCAAGLSDESRDHGVLACTAAWEIMASMDKVNAQRRKLMLPEWPIRIGIHSGSVISGVVGEKRVTYDIWGDGVNVAKRMQENSKPGAINISEATYGLVADRFAVEERGTVNAKNKGAIAMYYLKGPLSG